MAAAGLLILLAGCGSGGGPATGGASAETIKIGVPAPLSGDYASAGTDIVNAAKLAAEQINAQGGVLGKKIEIVAEDDQCDSQIGAQAAKKLIDAGVVAVAGGYCSSAALPEASAFAEANLAYVLDASTNPQLTEQNPGTVFRVIGRDDQQGPFAARFMAEVLKAHNVAIVHDNTTYAKGLADATKAAAQQDGLNVVYFDAINPQEKDFTSTLTAVKATNPDVLYFTGYFAQGGLIVKQMHDLGMTVQFMGGDANQDPTFIATAGQAAEGALITTAPLPKFLSGSADFVQAYKDAYQTDPGPYSVYEYDCVTAVAKAIENAGSTDPKAVVEALKSIDFEGITGRIKFDAKGDREGMLYMVAIVRDGDFRPYMHLVNDQWEKLGD